MFNFNRCNRCCNRRVMKNNCNLCPVPVGHEYNDGFEECEDYGYETVSEKKCCCEPVDKQVFRCDKDQQVRKHQHIVKHQHDIIDEYDVVHEHEYNYYDVVNERKFVKKNNFCKHEPDYCKEEKERERE